MFDSIFGMILVCVIVLIVFSLLVFIIKRYKKCPSDRVMVMSEGRKTAEFEAEGLTEETVMNAVFSMDGGLK